ncbi:LuxR family transcriptional regulator [Cereibacter sphaeroides]|uniref:helix-turn-helix transcriptional regulator n=1 Tax=Rhodobacterales TaxID=204455 RepID=UPI000BBF3817|nr:MULTISPECIES: LuxR family transcriptional regulator [Paracoccaceae]MCE6953053.1 LuxR family transcriptional regulator [Cereibacter sphaeroides]MCE6961848.1 LuxR family transcriptional regulator [Cereibacter sphaeroides]MCE6970623.1 LuxR family transcriptional regulator [Cereibacter sphaeroides]MCE6975781.1 LuxR family transcriptional regulator [Cereibacter sphaeroides]
MPCDYQFTACRITMEQHKLMHLSDMKGAFLQIAQAGFYVALRLGFYSPEDELNTFPEPFVELYTARGLALQDPLMRWTFTNQGSLRWSSIDLADPLGVMARYRQYGMRFGATICLAGRGTVPKKSFGIFARSDREFTDSEIQDLREMLTALHVNEPQSLTESQVEVLRMLSTGMRYKQMAYALGISESAVKARLKGAAQRMNAKTAAQAASVAASRGIL